jgi:hypothetical protein
LLYLQLSFSYGIVIVYLLNCFSGRFFLLWQYPARRLYTVKKNHPAVLPFIKSSNAFSDPASGGAWASKCNSVTIFPFLQQGTDQHHNSVFVWQWFSMLLFLFHLPVSPPLPLIILLCCY